MKAEECVRIIGCMVLCLGIVSGNGLDVIFEWKELDFAYSGVSDRTEAIESRSFNPQNNVPVGLEVWKNRLFITVPRWRSGVPASLAYVYLNETANNKSPKLIPYPNWDSHNLFSDIIPRFGSSDTSKTRIVSPFRIRADACDRLWILDTGKSNILGTQEQVGPNQLLVYNLTNDELLLRYEIPRNFMKNESFFANIAVDVKNTSCNDAFAYMADLGASSMVVYSFSKKRAWRITHDYFHSDPEAGHYNVAGVSFEWTDGLFGLALSAENKEDQYRTLYFHPFSSFSEFSVSTKVLQNETLWNSTSLTNMKEREFKILGNRENNTQSCASFMDEKTGVLFYTQVTRNAVGCWNTRHNYSSVTQGQVAVDNVTMVFPNDIKVDSKRNLWVLTDRMPIFIYSSLNHSDFNFRILSAPVDRVISQTVCASGLVTSSGNIFTPLGLFVIFMINVLFCKFM